MDEEKKLFKTLTIPLGNMFGYDKQKKELIPLEEDKRKFIYERLRDVSKIFARICNIITSRLYISKVLGVRKGDDEQNLLSGNYKPIIDEMKFAELISGNVLSQTFQESKSHFSGEHGKELLRYGTRQLSIHKTDGSHPIPVRAVGTSIIKKDGVYYLCVCIFNKKWANESGVPSWLAFALKFKPRDKTMASQLEKIIATGDDWKLKNARILRSTKGHGKRWLGQIMVSYTPQPYKNLDPAVIMGIDLGVNAPVTIHIRKGDKPEAWERRIGKGRDMLAARLIIRREITMILRALKSRQAVLTGEAREAAQKKLRSLRQKEKRFMKTASQTIAALMADIAKRNGAGTWQMENLTSEIKEDKPWLARNWAPGVVMDAIRWQAQQLGAEIKFIDPAYTSQRCSQCGHIDPANRPKGKKGAAYFKCQICGYENDADKNAARNISNPEIESLIRKNKPA